ncbi:MAG: rRNA maturation RNase YbeY [Phycisphaerales bacterium]|nr:rRNA maturation RNase YbeY [Phycisphaerales bacterium]
MTVNLDPASPSSQDEPEPASPCDDPPERAVSNNELSVGVALSPKVSHRVDSSGIAWIIEHARLAGRELRLAGEMRVRVIDDAEMSKLHEEHLADASTTDVMTFDLANGAAAEGQPMDADAHVCVDEAARRASELGHPVERELLLYVVHAMLHCVGHDDHDDDSYARMHAFEDEILERIGVGRTFAVGNRDSEAKP